jgi:hypothetical protein
MRIVHFFAAAAVLCVASAASAQTASRKPAPAKPAPNPDAPKMLGRFDDWVAATHLESGQTVCYAFTRASNSSPAIAGRGEVVLTVTERPTGRDAVAIAAGFVYPAGAEVTMQVDQFASPFYTAQRSAFARDGASVTAAFQRGKQAFARSNGPHGSPVADTFSLKGFSPAYAAVLKACPVQR